AFVQVGKPPGPPPGGVEGAGTAVALDVGDERLALRVLLELGVDAERLLQQLGHAASLLPPLAQRPREPGGRGDVTLAGPIHGDVAVALQQAHQSAYPAEQLTLVRAGQQRGDPPLVERVVARTRGLDNPAEGVE